MEKLRILINEDMPSDSELLEYEIRKGGFDFIATRVATREGFVAALEEFDPDIIISDYHLPSFDGMQALSLAREHSPLLPFIIVTGAMNEETAVECMKAGADDYVLKEHLRRLVPAIGLALANNRQRKEHLLGEERLAASERKFRALFEHANDAIFLLENGLFVDCNPMAEGMFGAFRDELLGRSPCEFSPEFQQNGGSSREQAADRIREAADGIPQSFEWRHRRPDGLLFDVDVRLSRMEIDDTTFVLAILRDISEKKRIEHELRDNEQKFKRLSQEFNALLDAIPDTILLQSPELEVVWANRAAILNFGDRNSATGDRHCYRLLHQTSAPHENCPVQQAFRTGLPAKSIMPMRGDMTWEVRAVPVRDENGELVNVIEIGRDVTEMKKLEQQLIHAQKMEAVGKLAGGIAHDFNNIVTALIGYGNLLLMKLPQDDPMRHYVEQMLLASERGAELTQGLLAFSRKKTFNLQPVNMNRTIEEFRSFLARIIGDDIEVATELEAGDLIVKADGSQLEQVLMNLVTNARDAMPEGGKLTIRTSRAVLDESFVAEHGFGEIGDYVCIDVADTGVGLDEEMQKKIFEPFFTTKEAGKGTGLGLSIVYGIIKEHRGYITVDSRPGQGARFRVYLPVMEEQAERTVIRDSRMPNSGTETLLLAEDDDSVRENIAKFLRGYGYTVIEARDGEEALEKFASARDAVALLILDVLMPKKGGREVAEEARRLCPDIGLLFNSGYPLDLLQKKKILEEGVSFFTKPINPRDLLKKVREVLDGETS